MLCGLLASWQCLEEEEEEEKGGCHGCSKTRAWTEPLQSLWDSRDMGTGGQIDIFSCLSESED